jgi:hypothetical protein
MIPAYPKLRSDGDLTLNVCSFGGCGKKHLAKGFCVGHYAQQKKGKPLTMLHPRSFNKKDLVTWWMENKSEKIGDCLVPLSNQKRDYPYVMAEGRSLSLSRMAYEVFKGSTRGMEVHHTCARTRCFNPDHLELVSQQANIAESKERSAYRRRIAELERALADINPGHALLEGI